MAKNKSIPISKPSLSEAEAEAVKQVIASGWISQGPKVEEFEKMFAKYVGAKYSCAVSNCTTALHMALLVVGVKPGDVVITVSHSFIATANVVRHCYAQPVFIDVEKNSFNMSPEALKKFIEEECEQKGEALYYRAISKLGGAAGSGRIAALLPVHQMGMPCDLAKIVAIAHHYKIPVVEDAACAIGSELSLDEGKSWERVGRARGDVVCFSFHPRKVVSTGEGGMLTTQNGDFDKEFRLLRQHGMSITDKERHQSSTVLVEKYVRTGFNYRMTDIQAAIGIVQLQKLPEMLVKRRKVDQWYRHYLGKTDWLQLPYEPKISRTNWQSYPVLLKANAPITRDALMQKLLDQNIMSKPGIMNAHEEAPYSAVSWHLPNSEEARRQVILLPLYCEMTEEDVKTVANAIL